MHESLKEAFQSPAMFFPTEEQITRGRLAATYFALLYGPADEDFATAYFIEKGVLSGRSSGGFQLDEISTVQEMIVLAYKVYIYATTAGA
jgi:hypothetical protein